jgi:hypothetical protein
MTFVEKHRFAGSHTEKTILKLSWEGEFFGVGLFEELIPMYPEHGEELTACSRLEWFNVHYCEPFAHDAGVHVTVLGTACSNSMNPPSVTMRSAATTARGSSSLQSAAIQIVMRAQPTVSCGQARPRASRGPVGH